MKTGFYIPQGELDKLERKCNQILKEVGREERQILLDAARYIKDGIKQNIRSRFDKKTGNLLGSPYAVAYPETTSSMAVAFAGIRPKRAPHAHLLESGTVNMPPHPFFEPAIDERKGPAMDMIEKGLKKTIEGAV